MKISEMKTQLAGELEKITAIRTLMTTENRVLTTDEVATVADLQRSVESYDASIKLAEDTELDKRSLGEESNNDTNNDNTMKKEKGSLELVRALVANNGKPTDEISEINRSLADNISTQGLFVRNYSYGTNGVDLSPTKVGELTVTESTITPKIWERMEATVYNGLSGGTQKLPFMSTIVGADVAEKAGITRTQTPTSHVELVPVRTGVQIEVTREGLSTFSQMTWDGVMKNVANAIDRKISAKIYAAAYAGATTVADVTLTKAGFDKLEAAVPVDGSYLMSRASFYASKSVAIDSGSGRFLASKAGQDLGETYEGTTIYHSTLFSDAATEQYIVYGVTSQIAIGFWGNDAYEMIVDPFTKAAEGTLVITVSKINDVKIPDADVAFSKSPDLDATS